MELLRHIAYWILWYVPCGKFAPRLLDFAIGKKGRESIARGLKQKGTIDRGSFAKHVEENDEVSNT